MPRAWQKGVPARSARHQEHLCLGQSGTQAANTGGLAWSSCAGPSRQGGARGHTGDPMAAGQQAGAGEHSQEQQRGLEGKPQKGFARKLLVAREDSPAWAALSQPGSQSLWEE